MTYMDCFFIAKCLVRRQNRCFGSLDAEKEKREQEKIEFQYLNEGILI